MLKKPVIIADNGMKVSVILQDGLIPELLQLLYSTSVQDNVKKKTE